MSNTVVNLSAQETAERLIPLLKEYAGKLDHICERVDGFGILVDHHLDEVARLICLHDTLEKPVSDLARQASGLLEHAELEQVVWAELKLRLDEVEEHLRFARLRMDLLKRDFVQDYWKEAQELRKLVEKTRYKAPF